MLRFRISSHAVLAIDTFALFAAVAISTWPALSNPFRETGSGIKRPLKASGMGRSLDFIATASRCETAGRQEIRIMCEYKATPHGASNDAKTTRIVLDRILISFEPTDESHMHVDLTFTNGGTMRISDVRTPYLVIDDDAGQNHVRRVLQEVDFRKIAPGRQLTFSNQLLIGSFRPGHYTIFLWIPDPDPSLKFSTAHNFLLSSVGVADPQTGLNTLASFTVMP